MIFQKKIPPTFKKKKKIKGNEMIKSVYNFFFSELQRKRKNNFPKIPTIFRCLSSIFLIIKVILNTLTTFNLLQKTTIDFKVQVNPKSCTLTVDVVAAIYFQLKKPTR